MSNDRMIASLLRERDGYERRGLDERVALVDEQLARHGYEPAAETDAAGPGGRTADSGQQTADHQSDDGKRGRGRPRPPRDAQGSIVKE